MTMGAGVIPHLPLVPFVQSESWLHSLPSRAIERAGVEATVRRAGRARRAMVFRNARSRCRGR